VQVILLGGKKAVDTGRFFHPDTGNAGFEKETDDIGVVGCVVRLENGELAQLGVGWRRVLQHECRVELLRKKDGGEVDFCA